MQIAPFGVDSPGAPRAQLNGVYGPSVTIGALLLHSEMCVDRQCNPTLCVLRSPTFSVRSQLWARRAPMPTPTRPAGVGQVSAARAVEGRLRGIHGVHRPQRSVAVRRMDHGTGAHEPNGPSDYPHHHEAASSGKPAPEIPCPNTLRDAEPIPALAKCWFPLPTISP